MQQRLEGENLFGNMTDIKVHECLFRMFKLRAIRALVRQKLEVESEKYLPVAWKGKSAGHIRTD